MLLEGGLAVHFSTETAQLAHQVLVLWDIAPHVSAAKLLDQHGRVDNLGHGDFDARGSCRICD